ncbi:MAG: AI-2E family transporter [Burkholderiales bacterium]|nr:AI-2E family transporter [Burkholderiales bacterium]MCE7878608.1 AI-2E family transporter [Betaproteobacteria bacterium PRO3]
MDPHRPDEPAATSPVEPARRPVTIPQYLWVVGAAIVAVLALHFLGPVLTPFLIGAIFAYLGTPIVNAMQRRGVPRALGSTVTVLLFIVAVLAVLLVLVPLVQAELALAMTKLPELAGRLFADVAPWVERNLGITLAFDLATLRDLLAENVESAKALSLRLLSGLRAGGVLALAVIVNAVLIPVVMFYLLRDWTMIWERFFELVPHRWRARTRQITGQVDAVLAEFLRGQGLVMVSLALYYMIGLSIAGLQYALPIGVLTGLLVFIPYVGFGTGFVLGMIAALLQWNGVGPFLAILSVYAVGQVLENYVLIPWLIGDRIGLHPLAVIFALLAFGTLFGFAGVLLALPASAALLVGLRHLRAAYSESALYGDGPDET